MAHINADLSQVDEQDFSPVPPGEYEVTVVDSEVKSSKNDNPYLNLEFEVFGPSHQGRKLWERFMLQNEIGLQRLKTLARVAGHPNPNYIGDSEELHGLMLTVRVKIEEQEGYDPKNKITSFKARSNGGGAQPVPQPAPPRQAQAANGPPVGPAPAPSPVPAPQAQAPAASNKPRYPWEA